MKNQLNKLTDEERAKLDRAPVYVSLLAAGSDGQITEKEKSDAVELSHLRTFTADPLLRPYYKEVEAIFASEFTRLSGVYIPFGDAEINEIKEELGVIYHLCDKLDPEYAELLKQSLKTYAEHVGDIHHVVLGYFDFSAFGKSRLD